MPSYFSWLKISFFATKTIKSVHSCICAHAYILKLEKKKLMVERKRRKYTLNRKKVNWDYQK